MMTVYCETMMNSVRRILLSTCLFVLCVGCGRSGIGESCTNEGKIEECIDNAVCARDKAANKVCLKVCTDQNQCSSNETCNGGTGTIKACRPN